MSKENPKSNYTKEAVKALKAFKAPETSSDATPNFDALKGLDCPIVSWLMEPPKPPAAAIEETGPPPSEAAPPGVPGPSDDEAYRSGVAECMSKLVEHLAERHLLWVFRNLKQGDLDLATNYFRENDHSPDFREIASGIVLTSGDFGVGVEALLAAVYLRVTGALGPRPTPDGGESTIDLLDDLDKKAEAEEATEPAPAAPKPAAKPKPAAAKAPAAPAPAPAQPGQVGNMMLTVAKILKEFPDLEITDSRNGTRVSITLPTKIRGGKLASAINAVHMLSGADPYILVVPNEEMIAIASYGVDDEQREPAAS